MRVRIKMKSYDHTLLDKVAKQIAEEARRAGSKVSGPIPLPVERRVYTILRSTNIDKKSREQFERRIHKRIIDLIDPTKDTMNALTKLPIPAGVHVEIKY